MSLNNFIPDLWSARFLETLHKSLVFANVCNRNYEGEITGYGDSVRINGIDAITVAPYTKNSTTVTPEVLTDNTRQLLIDQANFFAFLVDDVDKAQQLPKIMIPAMNEAAYNIRNTADSYIADLCATSTGMIVTGLGTVAAPIGINSDNVVEYIGLMAQRMDEANVPSEGRWLVIPPFLHQKLVLSKVLTILDTTTFENGRVGRSMGFEIYTSNNCYQPVAYTGVYKAVAGYSESITYADQLISIEALRHGTAFADIVRGLHIFGAKVVRPDSVAVLTCQSAAET